MIPLSDIRESIKPYKMPTKTKETMQVFLETGRQTSLCVCLCSVCALLFNCTLFLPLCTVQTRLPPAWLHLPVALFPSQFQWRCFSSSCWVQQTVHTWVLLLYPVARSSHRVPRSYRMRSQVDEESAQVDRSYWALTLTFWSQVTRHVTWRSNHFGLKLNGIYYWPAYTQCRRARLVMLSGVCRSCLSSSVTLHGGPVSFRPTRATPCSV